jgi:hypothetical protein
MSENLYFNYFLILKFIRLDLKLKYFFFIKKKDFFITIFKHRIFIIF